MSNLKISGVIVAGALLVTPAAVLAAGSAQPSNGKLAGRPHYKDFRGKSEVGKLTVMVARHRIASVELMAPVPPVTKNSSGDACGAITDFTSKAHTAKGSVSRSGSFGYTFAEAFKYGNTVTNTDTITLSGKFSGASRATGTFRDVSDYTAASATGKGHCDTGKLRFTVSHS